MREITVTSGSVLIPIERAPIVPEAGFWWGLAASVALVAFFLAFVARTWRAYERAVILREQHAYEAFVRLDRRVLQCERALRERPRNSADS